MIARLLHFHDREPLIALAQTASGRALIVLAACALLLWHPTVEIAGFFLADTYGAMIVGLALIYAFPRRRRFLLSLCSCGMLASFVFVQTDIEWSHALTPGTEAFNTLARGCVFFTGVLVILYSVFRVMKSFDRLPAVVKRYPVVVFHGLMLGGVVLIAAVPFLFFLVSSLWLIPYLLWHLGYMILYGRRGKMAGGRFSDHLFYLVPIYGGGALALGKGLGYLERHETPAGEPLARAQLSGLRLILLGILWSWGYQLMDAVVFGKSESELMPALSTWSLELPALHEDMLSATSSVGLAWLSVYLELFHVVLVTASWGGITIGCLRLLGFNVFRNTYKPLLAESIIDYWGRFSFYFKEICVDFFFYPTYMRCSWAGPQLRLFLAVFAAAFLGNLYFHILYDLGNFVEGGWAVVWAYWSPRIVYCLLLSFGIFFSMRRQQAVRRRSVDRSRSLLLRACSIFGVWTFFGLLRVWSIQDPEVDMAERLRFFAALVGI